MFILMGKVAITGGNMVSCYFFMKLVFKNLDGHDAVSSSAGPLICVGFVSYLTASIFLGVLETAVMALLTSLSIDIDLNKDPKYGPPTFHDSVKRMDDDDTDNFEALGNTMT